MTILFQHFPSFGDIDAHHIHLNGARAHGQFRFLSLGLIGSRLSDLFNGLIF